MARPFGTKDIKTAEELWSYFEAYRKEVKSNPRITYEFVGKDGVEVKKKLERPLTMAGFECYGFDLGFTFANYFNNVDDRYADYYTICTRIKNAIRQDMTEGGMVGQYNANLTARIQGYKDANENISTVNVKLLNVDPIENDKTDNSTSEGIST
jgi:hypothetical protein